MALLLTVPLIQFKTHFLEPSKKLNGSFSKEKDPVFSYASWFNNSFQQDYEIFFNQSFGFRNTLVRIHNQINYSLFKRANAKGVIVGKDNYLFESTYIDSYTGANFIGRPEINENVTRLQKIYSHLKKHQTEMLLIIAPGKAYFYPEYIPDYMSKIVSDSNNYTCYLNALKQTNIPILDFNDLFMSMKDTASIVIYPKTGIHWSQGILPYIADSIIKRSEQILNKKLNRVIVKGSRIKVDTVDKQDADIEYGMNLLYNIEKPKMTYPLWKYEQAKDNDKPNMIAIGDSFWWQLFNSEISKKVFNKATFWYYYKKVFPQSYKKDLLIGEFNALYELEQSDIVILITTESNLYKFPFGFEDVFLTNIFYDSTFNVRVTNLKNYITTNDEWYTKIKNKAQVRDISIDSMLYIDAAFIIKEEIKKELKY